MFYLANTGKYRHKKIKIVLHKLKLYYINY